MSDFRKRKRRGKIHWLSYYALSEVERKIVADLVREYQSTLKVSRKLEIQRGTVLRIAAEAGLGTFNEGTKHPKFKSEAGKEKLRRLYATGKYTMDELAEYYGVGRGTISNVVNYQAHYRVDDNRSIPRDEIRNHQTCRR